MASSTAFPSHPAAPGKQYSLDDAVEMELQLKERLANEEEIRELWALAKSWKA